MTRMAHLLARWHAFTYESEALEALSSVDNLEAISNGLVHLGVGLKRVS